VAVINKQAKPKAMMAKNNSLIYFKSFIPAYMILVVLILNNFNALFIVYIYSSNCYSFF
jgi:hypothetical protein